MIYLRRTIYVLWVPIAIILGLISLLVLGLIVEPILWIITGQVHMKDEWFLWPVTVGRWLGKNL